VELRGLGYPAIICKDMQASIDFYSKLGMRHLYTEPNRDDPESVQALLHAGGEDYLLLVGPSHEGVNIAESSPGVGSMQYLALHVSGEFIDQAYFRLSSAGLQASEEIRRGYERLVFLEDPNRVLIALVAWTSEPPEGVSRAAVLAKAGELKEEQGAPFLEDEHLLRAIAELSG
jgi:catechol 2,3-dioxygenase-like lactoylglutathione lyase family enzyme